MGTHFHSKFFQVVPEWGDSTTGAIRFYELKSNGYNFVSLKAPDLVPTNLELTLPNTDGSGGEVLTTDGSGNLYWSEGGGGATTLQEAYLGSGTYPGNADGNFINTAYSILAFPYVGSQNLEIFTGDGTLADDGNTSFGKLVIKGYKPTLEIVPHPGPWSSTPGAIRFYENWLNGSEYVALRAPDSIPTSYTLIFPGNSGASGEFLTTDGSGNLSWSTSSVTQTLQNAYDGGNTITTSSGTPLDVSGSGNISLTSTSTDSDSIFISSPGGVLIKGDPVAFENGSLQLLNSGNYIQISSPTLSSSTTYTLPATDGSASQVLSTDGSGNLSWSSPSSGSSTAEILIWMGW